MFLRQKIISIATATFFSRTPVLFLNELLKKTCLYITHVTYKSKYYNVTKSSVKQSKNSWNTLSYAKVNITKIQKHRSPYKKQFSNWPAILKNPCEIRLLLQRVRLKALSASFCSILRLIWQFRFICKNRPNAYAPIAFQPFELLN